METYPTVVVRGRSLRLEKNIGVEISRLKPGGVMRKEREITGHARAPCLLLWDDLLQPATASKKAVTIQSWTSRSVN